MAKRVTAAEQAEAQQVANPDSVIVVNTFSVELDITSAIIDAAKENIRRRLRTQLMEIGFTGTEPGTIAGYVEDLKALESIEPILK
ncbi:hypothetical protein [Filomicrobium sp.]|uniref:hypothetical protein n=1 Tax=Filomicrobium sp. TaxID=2024831 RepID=UPI0025865901|nr:hypothetical protein [Filomicrobium sp.]MCV0371736.1 hypothetical protein [Filomicrobium sp.]